MARRSAGPLNLSQVIPDKMVQQENHVCSFPLMPSNTPAIAQPTKKQTNDHHAWNGQCSYMPRHRQVINTQ
jgi:hypothetical protein